MPSQLLVEALLLEKIFFKFTNFRISKTVKYDAFGFFWLVERREKINYCLNCSIVPFREIHPAT